MSVLHRQLLRCARMMVRFNKRVLSQLHALLKNKKAGRLALPSFASSDSVPDGFLRAFWLALWLWVYRIHWVDCFIDRRNLCYLCSRLCLCLCCWICYCCIYWFYWIYLRRPWIWRKCLTDCGNTVFVFIRKKPGGGLVLCQVSYSGSLSAEDKSKSTWKSQSNYRHAGTKDREINLGLAFWGRLQYISRFIAQLTPICEPIFKLLRK